MRLKLIYGFIVFCLSTFQIVNFEEMEESVGENTPQKLSSASIESEIVTARETVITESA